MTSCDDDGALGKNPLLNLNPYYLATIAGNVSNNAMTLGVLTINDLCKIFIHVFHQPKLSITALLNLRILLFTWNVFLYPILLLCRK